MPCLKGLVLLDASALEARYLGPLLCNHQCRDIGAITDHGYSPAILQKTLVEIWGHAKLGTGNSPVWAKNHSAYPGPIDRVVERIRQEDPSMDARRTAWLWFNLSEEWVGRRHRLDTVRNEFLTWKQKMKGFCLSVEAALEHAGVAIVTPWHVLASSEDGLGPLDMSIREREIGLNSLLPNEDSAWLLDAILLSARAVVSTDDNVVNRGRLSLGFNLAAPSLVHPSRLHNALADDFGLAVYAKAD
jgi:hypothetical protein